MKKRKNRKVKNRDFLDRFLPVPKYEFGNLSGFRDSALYCWNERLKENQRLLEEIDEVDIGGSKYYDTILYNPMALLPDGYSPRNIDEDLGEIRELKKRKERGYDVVAESSNKPHITPSKSIDKKRGGEGEKPEEAKKGRDKLINEIRESLSGNGEQVEAFDAIIYTRDNLFITGKAGSGKTTFMRKILQVLPNTVVVAPTGIAALNAGGKTIHSFFGLDLDPYIPQLSGDVWMKKTYPSVSNINSDVIRHLDTVIIDEVSMVRPDLLDKMADAIRQKKGRMGLPFGGVRVIMFGDLNQLPPVVKKDDVMCRYYLTNYFFSSYALQTSGFKMFEFKKIYRQSDEEFVSLLNEVRSGEMSPETDQKLNKRVILPPEGLCVHLCTHNEKVSRINMEELSKVPGRMFTFMAEIKGEVGKDIPCEQMLELKVGCRVLITVNDPTSDERYVNGSRGTVDKIVREPVLKVDIDGKSTRKIDDVVYVLLDDRGEYDEPVRITRNVWKKMDYEDNNGVVMSRTRGTVAQFPLKLGYALSIHKSQGMTLRNVYIDAALCFAPGQAYVALSRCVSLDGLFLMRPIHNNVLLKDNNINLFYKFMEQHGYVYPAASKDKARERIDGLISKFGKLQSVPPSKRRRARKNENLKNALVKL